MLTPQQVKIIAEYGDDLANLCEALIEALETIEKYEKELDALQKKYTYSEA